MAYDENLAARIRDALSRKKNIEEKKMFGGVGFLLHGNMMVGVWKDSLIVRLGPDHYDDVLDNLKGWMEWALKFVGKLPAKEK